MSDRDRDGGCANDTSLEKGATRESHKWMEWICGFDLLGKHVREEALSAAVDGILGFGVSAELSITNVDSELAPHKEEEQLDFSNRSLQKSKLTLNSYVRAAGRLAAVSRIAFSTDCGTCSNVSGSME